MKPVDRLADEVTSVVYALLARSVGAERQEWIEALRVEGSSIGPSWSRLRWALGGIALAWAIQRSRRTKPIGSHAQAPWLQALLLNVAVFVAWASSWPIWAILGGGHTPRTDYVVLAAFMYGMLLALAARTRTLALLAGGLFAFAVTELGFHTAYGYRVVQGREAHFTTMGAAMLGSWLAASPRSRGVWRRIGLCIAIFLGLDVGVRVFIGLRPFGPLDFRDNVTDYAILAAAVGGVALGTLITRFGNRVRRIPLTRTGVTAACVLLALDTPYAAGAQTSIPVRKLGAVTATTSETFGVVTSLWQFADGNVLVNDGLRLHLVMLDATLQHATVVADSNALVKYQRVPAPLVPYLRDSVLFVDEAAGAFIVIGSSGSVGRTIAPLARSDLDRLIGGRGGGGSITPGFPLTDAGIDSRGRLIMRGDLRGPPPPPRVPGQMQMNRGTDSALLVRVDFETRTLDTITRIRVRNLATTTSLQTETGFKTSMILNPVQIADDWTVLSDGTVAVVRSHDYHIDWVDPDGRQRSSGKMPFDWRRLTEADKKAIADSQLVRYQTTLDDLVKSLPKGARVPAMPELAIAPLDSVPEYLSPVGTMRADRDGNLWILPTTSSYAGDGTLYDVVNRQGTISQRVIVPEGSRVAGFGPGGVLYLTIPGGAQGVRIGRANVMRN